jgi:hypothetical protein
MEAKFSFFFIRPRNRGLGRLGILSASRTDSSRGEPDSAGRLPACRCSYTPSRTHGGRDRLETSPPVAGIQHNIDRARFSKNFRAFPARPDLPIGVHPTNPFTVCSRPLVVPVYLFTSSRYKGGPPNLTVTWLEQFCVPASHTL